MYDVTMSKYFTPKQSVAHLKRLVDGWPSDAYVEYKESKLVISWTDYQGKTHEESIDLPRRINFVWDKNTTL